jgi:hypothetical protein
MHPRAPPLHDRRPQAVLSPNLQVHKFGTPTCSSLKTTSLTRFRPLLPPPPPNITHVDSTADALVLRKFPSPTRRAPREQGGRPTPCSSCTRTTPRVFECTYSYHLLPPLYFFFLSSTPTIPFLFSQRPIHRPRPFTLLHCIHILPPHLRQNHSRLYQVKKYRRCSCVGTTYIEEVSGNGDVMRLAFEDGILLSTDLYTSRARHNSSLL